MKTPSITYIVREKKYIVSLGNDYFFQFNNKKDASKFCSATDEFLLKTFVELNLIYCDLYTRYRNKFFEFYNEGTTNHLMLETECKQNLQNCESAFDKIIYHSRSENSNIFIFHDGKIICTNLEQAARILLEIYTLRSETQAKYCAQIIIENILRLSHSLSVYGATQATGNYAANPSQIFLHKTA